MMSSHSSREESLRVRQQRDSGRKDKTRFKMSTVSGKEKKKTAE